MTEDLFSLELTGEHIVLRKAREDDRDSMRKHVWGDEDVYRWMLFQPAHTEAEAEERCRMCIRYQRDHLAWFVALRDTDEAIGLCAVRENEPGHYEECGICIGTAFQGKGYGKEIVSLLLDLAFLKLGAEDLRYGYFQDNVKSGKTAEHFGFVYDRTEEMIRPWDGAVKKIDSCLLTRERYLTYRNKTELREMTGESDELQMLEEINEEAIPQVERCALKDMIATGGRVYCIDADRKRAGFMALRFSRNLVYLAYFAIRSDLRSRGIGGRALRELISRNPDRQVIVEYEAPGTGAVNDEMRIRRKQFYLRNGFYETGWNICYDQTEFEVACSKKDFDSEAFTAFSAELSRSVRDHVPNPFRKE